jgi:hypothetical protein
MSKIVMIIAFIFQWFPILFKFVSLLTILQHSRFGHNLQIHQVEQYEVEHQARHS